MAGIPPIVGTAHSTDGGHGKCEREHDRNYSAKRAESLCVCGVEGSLATKLVTEDVPVPVIHTIETWYYMNI